MRAPTVPPGNICQVSMHRQTDAQTVLRAPSRQLTSLHAFLARPTRALRPAAMPRRTACATLGGSAPRASLARLASTLRSVHRARTVVPASSVPPPARRRVKPVHPALPTPCRHRLPVPASLASPEKHACRAPTTPTRVRQGHTRARRARRRRLLCFQTTLCCQTVCARPESTCGKSQTQLLSAKLHEFNKVSNIFEVAQVLEYSHEYVSE